MSRKRKKKPSLGRTLRGLRKENGMSQAALAAVSKVSPGYLSQIENDEIQNPSAAVLLRIAAGLSVDPKVIMKAAGYATFLEQQGEEIRFRIDQGLVAFIGKQTLKVQVALLYFLASFMDKPLPTSMETSPSTNSSANQPVKRQRKQKLGDKIRSLREETNLSQGGLSKNAGVSQGYLSQLESGDVKNPSAIMIFKIAKALRVDSDELFEAAGYPTARQQQKLYQTEEARIPPILVKFLSELSRKQQRRLLLLLRDMASLMGFEEINTSLAFTR